jgi:serine/threonine protein kinase
MFNITTLTGLTVGQYTLKEQLGAGGMGVVYKGFQPTLEREVAIKILPPLMASQEGYIERFTREARTAAGLEHAHIVPIYDYGTQQELSYVVMRMLTGGSLAQRMQQRVKDNLPLPAPSEVSQMLKEIASALDYAHSRGVVHRDIKAGNIMFDSHGNAYLVDFGIAKLLDNMGLTGSGLAVGTPTHMSPEQWRGDEITPSTDQYALGVVIYELISGKLPFESSTAYALMNKHLNEPPTPLHVVRPDLPMELEAVLTQVLEKEPQFRYPTVTAFAEAFEKAIVASDTKSTQFFTFEVRPLKLKPDGELPSAFAAQMAGAKAASDNTPTSYSGIQSNQPKAKNEYKAKNQPLPIDAPELKQLRKTVERRINKRREMAMHIAAYVVVIPALWTVWAISGSDSTPWPAFVMFGWGAGLVAHAIEMFFESAKGDEMRALEFGRELDRRGIEADPNIVLFGDKSNTPSELWQLRKAVEKRVNKRRELVTHGAVFCMIIPLLWTIWAVAGADSFPWPALAMLGWGAGLAAHTAEVFFESERGDKMRAEEYRRELDRRGINVEVSAVMYNEASKGDRWERLKEDFEEEILGAVEAFQDKRRNKKKSEK